LPLLRNPDFSARVDATWDALARDFEAAYRAMPVKFMERTELTFHPYVKLLGYLALDLQGHPGDIVEIGVWKGRSLALMHRLSGPGTKAIGIDPCAMPGQERELPHFQAQVFPAADLVVDFSERAVAEVVRRTQTIKLLHIDGGHEAFNVWADFLIYERFIVPGGYIVFDDYADAVHSPGVRTAIDEMLANGLFAAFEVIGPVRDFENSFLLRRPSGQ
jgi:SAM-dependent methyltransferase